jgi:hypothetical protein
MDISSLSAVLSITREALRIQSDRKDMMHEDYCSCLYRALRNSRDIVCPYCKESTIEDYTGNVIAKTSALPIETDRLEKDLISKRSKFEEELRRKEISIATLQTKNDVLKHNFFLLEDKYKKLRAKLHEFQEAEVAQPIKLENGAENGRDLASEDISDHSSLKRKRRDLWQSSKELIILPIASAPLQDTKALHESSYNARKNRAAATSDHYQAEASISVRPIPSAYNSENTSNKYIEVVRNKAQRAALAGHTCDECREFYRVLLEQGFIGPDELQGYLQECSRHKSRFSPDNTPAGFWDEDNFSMPTPVAQREACAEVRERVRLKAQRSDI